MQQGRAHRAAQVSNKLYLQQAASRNKYQQQQQQQQNKKFKVHTVQII